MKRILLKACLILLLTTSVAFAAADFSFTPDAVPDNDITSNSVKLSKDTKYAIFCALTGTDTPTGDLILQVATEDVGAKYVAYDTVATAGAAVDQLWNVYDAGYMYFRVYYDYTSGGTTDTLSCEYTIKR